MFLPESAPWLKDFQNELLAFPNGRHDDQVDSRHRRSDDSTKPKRPRLKIIADHRKEWRPLSDKGRQPQI